jgi:hypothetical protein
MSDVFRYFRISDLIQIINSVVSLVSGLFTYSRNIGCITLVLLLRSRVIYLSQESALVARPEHKVSCDGGTYMIIMLYFK